MKEAPEQPLGLLRRILPKRLQPCLRGLRRGWLRRNLKLEEPFRSVFPYTQVGLTRLRALAWHAEGICRRRIVGDVVECGVLDGGSAAIMAAFTQKCGKRVHLFDAWEGLPASTLEDGVLARRWVGDIVGSPRRVIEVMRLLGVDESRLVTHKGWFKDTFPVAGIPSVALLHIDCDFYEATRDCLERWFPVMSQGGIVQVDDYEDFVGSRTAVDKFLAAHPFIKLLHRGTSGKAYYFECKTGT